MTTYLGEASGSTPGVQAKAITATGAGTNTSALYALTNANRCAVEAIAEGTYVTGYFLNAGAGNGLYGESSIPETIAIWGKNIDHDSIAVLGEADGDDSYGVRGDAVGGIGVAGFGYSAGVWAEGETTAIYGLATGGIGSFAAYLAGNVQMTASLEVDIDVQVGHDVTIDNDLTVSGTKMFRIDHPLDPANKYLQHACVESSQRKNVYDGTIVADAGGEAIVELPAWFEALNGDWC